MSDRRVALKPVFNGRAPLEAAVPCTAVEGILCSSSGQLLEGLVTNIFVVKGKYRGRELPSKVSTLQQQGLA